MLMLFKCIQLNMLIDNHGQQFVKVRLLKTQCEAE